MVAQAARTEPPLLHYAGWQRDRRRPARAGDEFACVRRSAGNRSAPILQTNGEDGLLFKTRDLGPLGRAAHIHTTQAVLFPIRAGSGRNLPNRADIRSNSTKSGQFGQTRPSWPGIDQTCAEFGQFRPNGPMSNKFGPRSTEFDQMLPRSGQKSESTKVARNNLARHRPNLTSSFGTVLVLLVQFQKVIFLVGQLVQSFSLCWHNGPGPRLISYLDRLA